MKLTKEQLKELRESLLTPEQMIKPIIQAQEAHAESKENKELDKIFEQIEKLKENIALKEKMTVAKAELKSLQKELSPWKAIFNIFNRY